MLIVSDEIESVDLESQIVRPTRQRRYGIRRRRRHKILFDGCCVLVHSISSLCCFLYGLLRKCNKTEAFLVVLEIVSLILAVVGKNKWNCLLAASVVSLLACVTTIMLCARRSADQLAEKILMAVDIGFSLIQLVTTLIYFGLAIMHKRIGFKESLFPLHFALTRYIFAFFSSSLPRDSPKDSLIAETRSTGVTNPDPPTSQIVPGHEVTSSSSCETHSSQAASTSVDNDEGLNPSSPATRVPTTDDGTKFDGPLPNFKVTGSLSCELFSSPDASTTVDIQGGLNHSSPAPYMSPTDKGDDPLPNFKVTGSSSCETLSIPTVSTTVHICEGSNHPTPATQLPSTDNEAKVGDPFLNFKVTNSSSCKPLNLSLDSISNDASSTASTALDIHEELNQSSPATHTQTDDEAKGMQSVADRGVSTSGHDLNYTDLSSSEHQQLSSSSFTSDPAWTTTIHSHEPLYHAQTDPTDNEANGKECLSQDFEESYVTSE